MFIQHGGPIHRLAPELKDRIIDQLWDDNDARAACSLAWRAWLPRTRHYRFRDISLQPWNRTHFFEILDISPDVGRYIQGVEFGAWQDVPGPTDTDEESDADSDMDEVKYGTGSGISQVAPTWSSSNKWDGIPRNWVQDFLAAPERYPAITRICFANFFFSFEHHLISGFTRLQRLEAFGCIFPSFGALAALLKNASRNLNYCFLLDVSWSDDTIDDDDGGPEEPLALATVALQELDSVNQTCLESWLVRQPCHSRFRNLRLEIHDPAHLVTVGNLVGGAGESLVDCTLNFGHETELGSVLFRFINVDSLEIPDGLGPLSLNHNPHLQRIDITVTQRYQLDLIPALLWTVRSNEVKDIFLSFPFHEERMHQYLPGVLDEVSTILSSSRFRSLRGLVIDGTQPMDVDCNKEELTQWMRGILKAPHVRNVLIFWPPPEARI